MSYPTTSQVLDYYNSKKSEILKRPRLLLDYHDVIHQNLTPEMLGFKKLNYYLMKNEEKDQTIFLIKDINHLGIKLNSGNFIFVQIWQRKNTDEFFFETHQYDNNISWNWFFNQILKKIIVRHIGSTEEIKNLVQQQSNCLIDYHVQNSPNLCKEPLSKPKRVKRRNNSKHIENVACKICFANKINIVYIPCGHCFCSECNTQIMNNLCAICRTPITKTQPLFI